MAKEEQSGKITVTNMDKCLRYSGDVKLVPTVETEISSEQLAFIEKNEKPLIDSGVLVIKK